MRYKAVPDLPGEAAGGDAIQWLTASQRAVPLVPGTEDDCCRRLQARLDLPTREAARELLVFLAALADADGPLDVDEAFAAVREHVPTWERNRQQDWIDQWTEQVRRRLAWAVAFGLVEEMADGYVLAES